MVERSKFEWNGKIGDESEWGILEMHICSRIREVGKQVWKNGFNDTERVKEYVQMKEYQRK